MNVSQALKKKNKLAIELKKQYAIAQKFNSQEAGNPRRYSVQAALDKAAEITAELIELEVDDEGGDAEDEDELGFNSYGDSTDEMDLDGFVEEKQP